MPGNDFEISYDLAVSKFPRNPGKILVQPIVTARLPENKTPAPQHVIFMIDSSVSMEGEPLEFVKQATLELIDQELKKDDVFSVISFNSIGTVIVANKTKNDSDYADNQEKIKAIQVASGTAIDEGLKLIGAAEGVQIDKNQDCRIVLLTDGYNTKGEINVAEEVKKLTSRIGPDFYIIPVGLGANYREKLLKEFGDAKGIKSYIHIKGPQDIDRSFNAIKDFLKSHTSPIGFKVSCNKLDQWCDIGAVSIELPGTKALAFNVDTTQPEINISFDTYHKNLLSGKIKTSDVAYNRDVIARFAADLSLRFTQREDISSEEKAIYLQRFSLPLLMPAYDNDSELVKSIRASIIDAIQANDKADINQERDATCSISLNSKYIRPSYKSHAHYILQKQVPSFNEKEMTVQVDDKVYRVVGRDIDFVSAKERFFISLDKELSQREAILIDRESDIVKRHQQKLQKKLSKNMTTKLKLVMLAEYVADTMQGDKIEKVCEIAKNVENKVYLEMADSSLLCVSLDDYLKKKVGFPRHAAPYMALELAEMVNNKVLPEGSVKQYRATSVNGNLAYTWAIYHDKKGGSVYLLDSSNARQKVYNLSERLERGRARAEYAAKGYEGILDEILTEYNLLDANQQIEITEELLASVKDEEQFVQAGLTDPISGCVMQHPVRIQDQDPKAVFDLESIKEWFAKKQPATNPLTNEKCSTVLVPAADVRNRIIDLICYQNRKTPAEGGPSLSAEEIRKKQNERSVRIQQAIADKLSPNKKSQPTEIEQKSSKEECEKTEEKDFTNLLETYQRDEQKRQERSREAEERLEEERKKALKDLDEAVENFQRAPWKQTEKNRENLEEENRKREELEQQYKNRDEENLKKLQEEQENLNLEKSRREKLKQDVESLRPAIGKLREYGKQLRDEESKHQVGLIKKQTIKKGQGAIDLANALEKKIEQLPDIVECNQRGLESFKKEFKNLIGIKKTEIDSYRFAAKTIIANILLGVLSLGLLTIGQVIYSAARQGQVLFFFQQPKTTRRGKVLEIEEKLDQLNLQSSLKH